MASNAELEERIRLALEGLQHSHLEINQTTRGVTFSLKVRDPDPYAAAKKALELYKMVKVELGLEPKTPEFKSIADIIKEKMGGRT